MIEKALVAQLIQPWVAAVIIILAASVLRKDQQKKRDDFWTALGFIAFSCVAVQLHYFLLDHIRYTYDAQFLALDRHLGFDPLGVLNDMKLHPWLWKESEIIYLALPIVMALAWVNEQDHVMRNAVLIGGIACWAFYALFPAAGPVYYFNNLANYSARNCMPSMHASWALMLAVRCRNQWKEFFWGYASLLVISTITLGEHYVIDIIAAVPYTFGVLWVAQKVKKPLIAERLSRYNSERRSLSPAK